MSRSRYYVCEADYPYFMTSTIVAWLPVFTRPEANEIIYESWRYLQLDTGFQLFGYAILHDHLHLIAKAPDLSRCMQRFKAHTARRLIALLDLDSSHRLLEEFQTRKLIHKTRSVHQIWQEGSHPQQIRTDAMMQQKLDYIHANPVRRGYTDDPLDWRHSSARDYAGLRGKIEVVVDWR